MSSHQMYIAVDHAHGMPVTSEILRTLMESARYENIKVHPTFVSFTGGNPKQDVQRWYQQGQTKVSILHLVCDMRGDGNWNFSADFYGNRRLSKRISKDRNKRFVFSSIPGQILQKSLEDIVTGGMPSFDEVCVHKLICFSGIA